jgi:tetraacyldisaccharide 4'-kinase
MILFKPRFWDKNKISFISIVVFPISLIIKIFSFLKKKFTKTCQFSIPIICVGNIYLGGTGKTPLCIEIFSILKNLNMNPVFVRKKYTSFQDEANLQESVGPVYQHKKRGEAIKSAIKNHANIAILDDGFQDFSISKNLSIVCFNEKQWIGNGFTIPSGPLRESLSGLKRADCVVINGEKNINIENQILNINDKIKIFYITHILHSVESFKNKKVTAFAGIGNPDKFFTDIEYNKIDIIEKIKFPDHYNYSRKEMDDLVSKSKKNNTILLTTEKDYFRISKNYQRHVNYLKISVKIEDKINFIKEIEKII